MIFKIRVKPKSAKKERSFNKIKDKKIINQKVLKNFEKKLILI